MTPRSGVLVIETVDGVERFERLSVVLTITVLHNGRPWVIGPLCFN